MDDTLDDIAPGVTVTMTEGLKRLFAAAGCDPTRCHACGRLIGVGRGFRLQTHTKPGAEKPNDEMVCDRCDDKALDRRDKREDKKFASRALAVRARDFQDRAYGGYSRPTKGAEHGA